MKIACVSTSQVPSSTANSIQLMKVCHALAGLIPDPVLIPGSCTAGLPGEACSTTASHPTNASRPAHQVCLWTPGQVSTPWENLAAHYGLAQPFELRWLPSWPLFRRYDFAMSSLQQARAWGADLIYTWLLPTAVLALQAHLPVVRQ